MPSKNKNIAEDPVNSVHGLLYSVVSLSQGDLASATRGMLLTAGLLACHREDLPMILVAAAYAIMYGRGTASPGYESTVFARGKALGEKAYKEAEATHATKEQQEDPCDSCQDKGACPEHAEKLRSRRAAQESKPS